MLTSLPQNLRAILSVDQSAAGPLSVAHQAAILHIGRKAVELLSPQVCHTLFMYTK
jgi:hypothetical protein